MQVAAPAPANRTDKTRVVTIIVVTIIVTTLIDVVAADEIDRKLLVGECKWRNNLNETETLSTLQDRCRLLPGYNAYERYLFTKVPCFEATQKKAQADSALHLVSVDQMFE